MTTFAYAPQVAEIGRRLIAQHHKELLEYGDVRIEYLFRDKHAKKNGKTIWGTASKVGGRNAFLAMPKDDAPMGDPDDADIEPFFVVEIAYDIWLILSAKQRVALIDHELTHLTVEFDDGIKLGIRGHDVEDFESILKRHGLYHPGLESFAHTAADQLRLLESDGRGWQEGDETGEVSITVPNDLSGMDDGE